MSSHVALFVGIVTSVSFVVTAMWAVFKFYNYAQVANELVHSHVSEIKQIHKDVTDLKNNLEIIRIQLDSLDDAFQKERDTQEFSNLSMRKDTLSLVERVRYCELHRKLNLGGECEITL